MKNPSALVRRAAGRFVIGFDGTTLTAELRELIELGIGGVILFRRNVVDPFQVAALNAEILRAANRPLFVSVDQEGGPVQRLRAPFTEFPPHGVLGKIDDSALTQKVASVIARELGALGFNADYAPLADVNTNAANPVIGIRSFGETPELVGCHAAAWIDGMQGAGMMACAKHFPGHGDTSQDSHYSLPRLSHGVARMEAIELPPFAKCIEHRVASIMTAHVVFEQLDPGVPATLSRKVLTGLLREKMGYDGLIVSDDLEMKAIADTVGVAPSAVQSIEAGADILLVCKSRDRILESIEAVAKRFEKGLPDGTDAADARIAKTLAAYRATVPDEKNARRVIGADPHRALVDDIAARAKAKGIAWTPSAAVASSPVSTT